MTTSHVRFKISDLENMIQSTDFSTIGSNEILNSAPPAASELQSALSDALTGNKMPSLPNIAVPNIDNMLGGFGGYGMPEIPGLSEAFSKPGATLEKLTGINPGKITGDFFKSVFNSGTYDDIIDGMANTLNTGFDEWLKCMLRGLIYGWGYGGYGGPGMGGIGSELNRLAKNCLVQAAAIAISKDLGLLTDTAYDNGYYGTVGYLSNTINDKSITTRLAADVMMKSITKNDHAGMFDVMTSSVAGNVRTIYPNITDTMRGNFQIPPTIRPNQYPQYGTAVFSGMNRMDPNWYQRPRVPQTNDFTTLLNAAGRVIGRNNPIASVGVAFLSQTLGQKKVNPPPRQIPMGSPELLYT